MNRRGGLATSPFAFLLQIQFRTGVFAVDDRGGATLDSPHWRPKREPTNLSQGAVAAAPALGLLRPAEAAAADLPKAKITRVRIYQPPNLNPLFNQSNMVVHGRDRHRHHRHRRRRREGHARAVRRHADRQEPVPDRGDLAGDVHRLVLSARAARRRTRSARSISRSGTSRARRSACRCTSCSAARRATTASATPPAASTPPARRPARRSA